MNELLIGLKEEIEKAVEDLGLREPGASKKTVKRPNVFIGIYSRDKIRNQNDFPFVAIVPSEGMIGEEEIQQSVSVVCGVYNPDREPANAVIELGNVMMRISQYLSKKRIIAKRYELMFPIEVYTDMEARHPFYQGEIVMRFLTGNVERELDASKMVDDYGAGYE